ncbi:phosphotransferase family protein [Jiangella alba]|uniref:Phosphotransferase enzyme family protein n=1 Tax=Jiangella alba TaxID=561176 RepID=A0A1H5PCI1_9ACTN|nr:phosphotransferase [Jiangella alba]SEF11633.1 Phosphotransferase enzyme family protein [Jiangella alba]
MHHPLTAARRDAVLHGLTAICGRRPVVVAADGVGHHWAPVTRLVFDRDLPGVGGSVIVKTRRVDGAGHGGPAYLRREVAGLRTLGRSEIAARVILADDEAGVVVQSDLGTWPTLEQVLLGDDRARAAAAMVAYGRAVGRLHASTSGRRADHEAALAEFGAADVTTGGDSGTRGTRRWSAVEAACADLGLPDARIARDDLAFVRSQLDDPGAFAALVHDDLNPTNALVTEHGVRLVDFEGSRYGHIGFDVSFLHYPFPHHSPNWSVLPVDVVDDADRAYRAVLAESLPADVWPAYDEMLAVGAATALAGRVTRLPLIAQTDQSAYDSWRRRAQLVQQLGVFRRLAARAGILHDLAVWSAELADAMVRRWPDAGAPPPRLYPAFAGTRSASASSG